MSTPETRQSQLPETVSQEGLQEVIDRIAKAQKEVVEIDSLDCNLLNFFDSGTQAMVRNKRAHGFSDSAVLKDALKTLFPGYGEVLEATITQRQELVDGTGWSNDTLRDGINSHEGPM